MEWSDSLSINVHLIDEQHKQLVKLFDSLQKAKQINSNDPSVVKDALEQMASYAITHFTVEEEVMRIYAYPDYELHKKEHHKFIIKIESLLEDLESNEEAMLLNSVVKFLERWIQNHILISDKKIGPHLNKNGLK